MLLPEPLPQPDEDPRLGSERRADPFEEGALTGRQQGEHDLFNPPGESVVPPENPADTGIASLTCGQGSGPRVGALGQGGLHLVERGVPVGYQLLRHHRVADPAPRADDP